MPRIYVGTYGKYNAGSLEGAWFDLEDYACKDDFLEACQEFHGPGEHEFMFQDREGIPSKFVSECSIDADFWDYMDYDDGYDGAAKDAFVDWAGVWDQSSFEAAFRGKYDSELDYAYAFVDDVGYLDQMPEHLRFYFDYEKFANDLFVNDVWFADGFVFDRNY